MRNVYGDPTKVDETLVDRHYQLTLREGNRLALVQRFQQSARGRDAARIQQLRVPTLILWGGRDQLIPLAAAALFPRHTLPAANWSSSTGWAMCCTKRTLRKPWPRCRPSCDGSRRDARVTNHGLQPRYAPIQGALRRLPWLTQSLTRSLTQRRVANSSRVSAFRSFSPSRSRPAAAVATMP